MTLNSPNFRKTTSSSQCYHCGESCRDQLVSYDEKNFCCDGCKAVYQILNDNGLCGFYEIDESKGISPKLVKTEERFAYLDDAETATSIISFQNATEAHLTLSLPQMHCSSCVWLLEHLYKLNPGIVRSQTDFIRKSIFIAYRKDQTTLRQVVELLATLGYEPELKLIHSTQQEKPKANRERIYRLTVAGFCFGNIMLLSFPEYLSSGHIDHQMVRLFSYLNLGLSLPVLLYSASEFFISAWQGLKARFLNIDLPLSLSLAITFSRSVYEILSGTGAGYLDSMAGITFFMLIGRYFQDRTHVRLQFDRDFRSFFPISIRIKNENGFTTIPLSKLKKGNRVFIRSQELIPADAKLISGDARIDYSFVTGESVPQHVEKDSIIYAGGRQTAGQIELEIVKEVEQSYLTKLWNRKNQKAYASDMDNMVHKIARRFTLFLIILSIGSFLYWLPNDIARGTHALTTILIVACPCSLLLSATFTHAAVISILGKNGVFIKHANLLEKIASIRTLVWDKTGTITSAKIKEVQHHGASLNDQDLQLILTVASQSLHPLSRALYEHLRDMGVVLLDEQMKFEEFAGKGIEATLLNNRIQIGSADWLGLAGSGPIQETKVFIKINGQNCGYFTFGTGFREGLDRTVQTLQEKNYTFALLSGDQSAKVEDIQKHFPVGAEIRLGCSPHDKRDYIAALRKQGKEVMMIGDGLNDAGALMESNIGWAISEDINNFTPASDVIMESSSFAKFPELLTYIGSAKKIVIASFILSLMYNVVGLSIAVQGTMSPLIAAILMPASSISIILFTTGSARIVASRLGLRTSSL